MFDVLPSSDSEPSRSGDTFSIFLFAANTERYYTCVSLPTYAGRVWVCVSLSTYAEVRGFAYLYHSMLKRVGLRISIQYAEVRGFAYLCPR